MVLNPVGLDKSEGDIQSQVLYVCQKAKEAAKILSTANSETKNKALNYAADAISANKSKILEANAIDVQEAKKNNISKAFLDRLILNEDRIKSIEKGLRSIADLPDPVGKELKRWNVPSGLDISKVATPLGVIGVIYESRPNVTADAGALCLKSGNAAILRGGSESFYSSRAILEVLQEGIKKSGLPSESIQLIPVKDREAVGVMLNASEYIDVIVPRGGKGLIKRIKESSKIPTFEHLEGNCHTYINQDADKQMAVEIVTNAKMRRTGICGATESIVIDEKIAGEFIPEITSSLIEKGCEIRGDEIACIIDGRIKKASQEDWDTEYLDAIVSLKVLKDIDEAISFIQEHSSSHTDSIITNSNIAAQRFFNEIDSAIVMQNASTQFADGGEFGMGAEIGIATGKMHARGPVGLEQLCTFKYVVRGSGQIRA